MFERVPTGVVGLDDLTGGGYPSPGWVLIEGPFGTGKTVLALSCLRANAEEGRTVALDCIDRPYAHYRDYAESFGWKVETLRERGEFVAAQAFPEFPGAPVEAGVLSYEPSDFNELTRVDNALEARGVRVVAWCDYDIAGLSALRPVDVVAMDRWSLAWCRGADALGVAVLGGPIGAPEYTAVRALVEADMTAIIETRRDESGLVLRVRKMEGASHPNEWLPFSITATGPELLLPRR
jgi:KaiC/GvpD/RAD55 family RecA-like ATPase